MKYCSCLLRLCGSPVEHLINLEIIGLIVSKKNVVLFHKALFFKPQKKLVVNWKVCLVYFQYMFLVIYSPDHVP